MNQLLIREIQLSKRSASTAQISCAREQPSRCLLHADWIMVDNALFQVPHVRGESGAYSRQRFLYWLAWSGVRFLSLNIDIPWYKFTILRLFNILPYISLLIFLPTFLFLYISLFLYFHTFLSFSNKWPDTPLVWAPCGLKRISWRALPTKKIYAN